MPYDVVATNRQAVQSGLALGRAMFDNSLRMQELQSREALRRLEEQQRAQKLAFDLDAYNLAVQERADMEKAAAAIQAESMLTMPQFGPPMVGQGALPDVRVSQSPSAETIVKHTLPVVMKYRPREVDNFLANTALYESRQALAQESGPGAIQTVQGPGGQQLQVYVPPRGRGANQIVGGGNVPTVQDAQGNSYFLDPKGKPTRIPRDQSGLRVALADNALAKEHLDLSEDNPDFPGLRRVRGGEDVEQQLAVRSRLTPTARSDIEQRIVKREGSAKRFLELAEKAETIFGPKALLGTVVVDRVLANFNPKLVEGQRVQGREAARLAMEGVFQSLSEGQGRLSDQDVSRYMSMFPELGNVKELVAENPERARQVMNGLVKQLARDAINEVRMLGRKPTVDMLSMTDPLYLVEQVNAKTITLDEYKQAIESSPYTAEINALLNGR